MAKPALSPTDRLALRDREAVLGRIFRSLLDDEGWRLEELTAASVNILVRSMIAAAASPEEERYITDIISRRVETIYQETRPQVFTGAPEHDG